MRVPFVDVLSEIASSTSALSRLEFQEWGDCFTHAGVQSLLELCPYQNIRASHFPPVLISCAADDARIPVAGVAKWISKLRAHQEGDAPILLNVQATGGHFGDESLELHLASTELAFMEQAVHQKH